MALVHQDMEKDNMRNTKPLLLIFLAIPLLLACAVPTRLYTRFVPNGSGAGAAPFSTASGNSNYQPSASITQLADAAGMTDKARQIFFAAQPVIDSSQAQFDRDCNTRPSATALELGCYTSNNRIYILQIPQPQLSGEMKVVAAHEMLHAVYAQLSSAEIATLTPQMENAMARLNNANLNQQMQAYQRLEPGQRDNELHSILGTEYGPLSTSLEQYYSQYFTNRMSIVRAAQQFQGALSQMQYGRRGRRGQ